MSVSIKRKDAIYDLVDNLASITFNDLPAEATEITKNDILDTLGVTLAGGTMAPVCEKVVDLVHEVGGKEESTIIGYSGKVPSHMAAFANATLAHALNYDDYHDSLRAHFGCIIFPAAYAIAERVGGINGKEFITAYTLGLDLAARMNRALITKENQRDWNLYGWLTTQLVGYFGAAAVAGRILGLDREHLIDALGLAYSQVAGNKQSMVAPGADKGIYSSYAAMSGVFSVLMAQKGIAGPKDCLEGQAGFYNVYFQGAYDRNPLIRDLGKVFEGVGFHIYPCCTFTHSRIEVVSMMRDEYNFYPEDIETITLHVGSISRLLCEPLEIRRNPRIMAEAQYSLPFTVAAAITKGSPRIEHFTAAGIKDPEILSVSNKVNYLLDENCDLQYGTGICPTKVEIRLKSGRVLFGEQSINRYGHPERPISKDDLKEKFRECASYSVKPISGDNIEKIISVVNQLETIEDVTQIIRMVS
ncbi:MmgE/PrpD family protein [Chloroflexota bacterium]